MQGKTLSGRYYILEKLAEGGFGATFIAEDRQRPGNPKCVVKLLQPRSPDSYTLKQAKRLFDQEAEILENLGKHQQIPQLLAHIEENNNFYLVQEYIEGKDLSEEIPPGKQLSETETIQLLREILEVLVFVHQNHVIHRDIKPANIRRRKDGKIVLIDFGAVKQIKTQIVNHNSQTNFTIAIGTPGYTPTEQSSHQPKLSSDIYAVGMIGIQALTGISPLNFQPDIHTGEIIWRNSEENKISFHLQVSPKLAALLDKMVRYDYRQRYPSALEALTALNSLSNLDSPNLPKQAIKEVAQTSTCTIPTKLENPKKRPKKLVLGLGFTLLGITSVGLFLFLNKSQDISKYQSYKNNNLGIKIKYPSNWEQQNINNPLTQEIVTFLSNEVSSNTIKEKLTISINNYSGTLDESQKYFTQDIKNRITEANIIDNNPEDKSATLANKEARKIFFTGKDGNNILKNLQVWTLKGDKAYVLIYTADKDDFDKFLPSVENMIKSFEIE
jgi:eukaryotic-like serine/threonine-protein kinase